MLAAMELHSRRRRTDLTWAEYDDGCVILDLRNGGYFGLNRVGRIVWAGLGAGDSDQVLLQRLLSRFSAPPEVIKADLEQLLRKLGAQDLLHSEALSSSTTP